MVVARPMAERARVGQQTGAALAPVLIHSSAVARAASALVRASFLVVLAPIAALYAACATSGEACELNSDCLAAYCRDGQCVQDCVDSNKDCPKGYVCNGIGQCEYAGSGGGPAAGGGGPGSGGAGASSAGGQGTGGDPTTNDTTSTLNGMGGAPPATAALLSVCTQDGDCDSGMCRPERLGAGLERCTEGCSVHADCASGFRCEEQGAESYCVRSDVGRGCSAAGQCHFACLSPLNYCTSSCSSGADCPSGYGCMPVGGANVCVRAAADCAADTSQCVSPAACDTSLVVSSCTLACDTASDCPQRGAGLPPWTCDGACRRPGDVYGPLPGGFAPAQWACNASLQVVNLCNDGLHIDFGTFMQPNPPSVDCGSPFTTDGLPGDACLDSCRYQGGCPMGFGCAAVAELAVNQRIGLCMPAGAGEVGASCSSHGDCAFSLCESGTCSRDCSRDGACPEGSTCTAQSGTIEGQPYRICL